jgi:hypothetical protein
VIALAAALVVSFAPNPAHFGELVTATVHAPGTPSFKPFVVRAQHGNVYVLQCLDPGCVPGSRPRTLTVAGTRLVIVPRATPAQVARPLRSFRRQTEVPPTAYRIRPAVLRALLLAGALLLASIAALLVRPFLRRLIPERVDRRTALERALDLVRSSLRRNAPDRRRALDLLGRELGRDGSAREALGLAWSRPDPDPPRVESLVERVEERR